jgi:hypothetical protein
MQVKTTTRGTIFHIPNDNIGAILLESGLIELVPPAPVKIRPIHWFCSYDPYTLEKQIEAHWMGERMKFQGATADKTAHFHGEKCPEDVAAEYRKLPQTKVLVSSE